LQSKLFLQELIIFLAPIAPILAGERKMAEHMILRSVSEKSGSGFGVRKRRKLMNSIRQIISAGLCGALLSIGVVTEPVLAFQAGLPANATNSSGTAAVPQTPEQLDALVAPIALYPDSLVAQILAAATLPDQVAIADYWLSQHKKDVGSQR
jgi:hypothetical protein